MSQGGYESNLMIILEAFSTNLSIEKVKKAGKLEEIIRLVNELEKVKYLLPSNNFLQVLRQKLYCGYCLENLIEIQTNCGHGFCTKCFEFVESSCNKSKSNLVCLICQDQLTLLEPLKNFNECTQCGNFLHDNFFYEDPLCHPICKMCVFKKIWIGSVMCVVCDKKLKLNYESKYNCSLCKKKLKIITSNFLCGSHPYCFKCFKAGLSEGRCFVCVGEIKPELKADLITLLSANCILCKNSKERSLFINKTCCFKKICVTCQVKVANEKKFGIEKCMGCQSKLELKASLEI